MAAERRHKQRASCEKRDTSEDARPRLREIDNGGKDRYATRSHFAGHTLRTGIAPKLMIPLNGMNAQFLTLSKIPCVI